MSESADGVEMRQVFGQTLVRQGQEDPRMVVLDNDSGATTMAGLFDAAFPRRYFDVGIAEKNLFGTAAGLVASGFIPIATTFAVFAARWRARPNRNIYRLPSPQRQDPRPLYWRVPRRSIAWGD